MFCYQCGATLIEGAAFCFACGTKAVILEGDMPVPQETVSVPTKQPPEMETPPPEATKMVEDNQNDDSSEDCVEITVLDTIVEFDKSIETYKNLRYHFYEQSHTIHRTFTQNFYTEYRDMDHFIEHIEEDLGAFYDKGITEINAILSTAGIFGITDEELDGDINRYCRHLGPVLDAVIGQYDKIIANQKGKSEYRQRRKASRGRVIGGGFGVSGAVKGMATAGAMNMATGAVHSVGNTFGEIGSAIGAASQKDSLFKSPSLRYKLGLALSRDIEDMHLVVIDLLNEKSGLPLCRYTRADEERAQKIQSDLETKRIDSDSIEDAIVSMLTIYPFDAAYYRTAIKVNSERTEGLKAVASYFDIDVSSIYDQMIEKVDCATNILLEYQDYLDTILDELSLTGACSAIPAQLNGFVDFFRKIFEKSKETRFYFLPTLSKDGKVTVAGAKQSYASYQDDIPLIQFDTSWTKNGKDGFLITTQTIYCKKGQISLPSALVSIEQTTNPSNKMETIAFGQYSIQLSNPGLIIQGKYLADFMEMLIAGTIFLTEIYLPDKTIWEAIAHYHNISDFTSRSEQSHQPHERKKVAEYCKECGNLREDGAIFCNECGTKFQ